MMPVNPRFALLTIALAASFAACSGGAAPVPSATTGVVDDGASPATISVTPSSVDVLVGKSAKVSVSEKGYKGQLASKTSSACSRIASWSPASGKGPVLRVTVRGKARGSCVLSFVDADKHIAHLKITVQTPTASPSPSPSPSPSATLNPVPLFVSTGNVGAGVVQIPVGCTTSSCQTPVGGGFAQPEGLAFDGSGNLYVADFDGGSQLPLYEVPPGCTSQTCVLDIASFFASEAVAVDPFGNVYVAADNLYEIPSGCTMQNCILTVVGALQAPTQLASDASGNIYIADSTIGLVEYVKGSSFTTESSLPYITNGPTTAVAFSNGKLYQAYDQDVQVAKLSCLAGGGGPGCFTSIGGGFFNPTGLAVDPSGDVYVADAGNQTVYGVPRGCLSQACTVAITPAGLPGAFGIAVQVPSSAGKRRR